MATLYFSNQSSFLLFGLGLILTSLVLCQSHPLTDALTHTAPKTHVCALRRFFSLAQRRKPYLSKCGGSHMASFGCFAFRIVGCARKMHLRNIVSIGKEKVVSTKLSHPEPTLSFLFDEI